MPAERLRSILPHLTDASMIKAYTSKKPMRSMSCTEIVIDEFANRLQIAKARLTICEMKLKDV